MASPSARTAAACNRFGLGARPGEQASIDDAGRWLLAQLGPAANPDELARLPTSADYLVREYRYRRNRQEAKRAGAAENVGDAAMRFKQTFGPDLIAEAEARWRLAIATPDGFRERIVRFWSNHFAVSVDKGPAGLYAAPMEREAIRPHAFGRFNDLLLAVETHPAMLRYLDNALSSGPDSIFSERIQRRGGAKKTGGLNENLAREILELHTLGVNGGYTQADVGELARAITGWSLFAPRDLLAGATPSGSGFVFRAAMHEPGARTILGKRYADGAGAQGRAILTDLASHPATAQHISFKLARHFVSDSPPQPLVERLTKTWLDHAGDLAPVYRTLVESREAWADSAAKFKTPQDFVVSALRATRVDPSSGGGVRQLVTLLDRLGQPDFKPRSPAGYPDTQADWLEADALWKRVQAAQALAERAPREGIDALGLARDALGPHLDMETQSAIERASSLQQAIATVLAAPAFQWRV